MKILVSGASGLLGTDFRAVAQARGHQCEAFDRMSVRMGSIDAVTKALVGVDIFLHAAANTNVEACEREPGICYRDNVLLTEMVCDASRRRSIPVVYISSTGVYGDYQNLPYSEYDNARPTTHHHKSKLLAEDLVLSSDWNNIVVRTGWLFGGDRNAPKNFVARRIAEAQAASEGVIYSNPEQRGCPSYVRDVSQRILELVEQGQRGVFNCVNEGFASRFDYVKEIITAAGIAVEVQPTAAASFHRIAPVSNNECALNWKSAQLGMPPMRDWKAAVAEYLALSGLKECS